ncbi:MAG: type II and III secretion system protein family protein [Pseudomonadota bacterium]
MVFLLIVLLGMTAGQPVNAASGISVHGRSGGPGLDIPINKSDVIHSRTPFFEVAVGNPEIADVQVLGEKSLYIFGRAFGSTSVTLSDERGRIIAVVDVNVTHDVARLKRMLHTMLPGEPVAVRAAHDGVILSGTVSSPAVATNALTIAERFAPDSVSNLMSVRGSQQVMLAVRFVEMRRETAKRLGINGAGAIGIGGSAVSLVGEISSLILAPPSLAQFGLNIASGATDVTGFLDLLEDKGIVRTLAEPTLVAMSGDNADFLAGGEFPIPVGARDGEIKIEFKKFGVGLSFTPTVLRDDLMNIALSMEVSEPDETTDLELLGIRIPGLVVRRATTTVELRNAESFAIAGLLSESFSDQVKQLPFLGDLPILGALTRSTQYQQGQTELVMIVTPYLVEPTGGDRLRTPDFSPPSERELFLFGEVERSGRIDPRLNSSAGFSGPHGFSLW